MPTGNLSQYSQLEQPTLIVDGQKFTKREILLRYGTLADTQNPAGWHVVVFFDRQLQCLSLLVAAQSCLLDQNQVLNFASESERRFRQISHISL
jgi:hypothetical protein